MQEAAAGGRRVYLKERTQRMAFVTTQRQPLLYNLDQRSMSELNLHPSIVSNRLAFHRPEWRNTYRAVRALMLVHYLLAAALSETKNRI